MTTKVVVLTTALALGAGGVAVITANASAGGGKRHSARDARDARNISWASNTIRCPDVGNELRRVPRRARLEVDRQLAQLDNQVADAYRRLSRGSTQSETILKELRKKRSGTISRIDKELRRRGARPGRLGWMNRCEVQENDPGEGQAPGDETPPGGEEGQNGGQGEEQNGGQNGGEDPGQNGGGAGNDDGGGQGNGPSPDDFIDITTVEPNVNEPQAQEGASTGTFTTECGRNEEGHFNSDNVIAAPGVSNGAHHVHDYVGNLSTDGFSTNESLAAAETTCANGDLSSHYWPVVRLRDGTEEVDANEPGGGQDGNIGRILQPAEVSLTFRGSPVGEVTEMPRFLRIITGDAKSFTNGPANANASWSCTGFEDRQLTDKYPICPEGSQVVRTFDFQSCWDGQNIDSANHRTHVVFANEDGSCNEGFQAIPQLVQRIVYDIPPDTVYAVDSFPEQLHKPETDHSDFINVMPDELMREAVECINSGRNC